MGDAARSFGSGSRDATRLRTRPYHGPPTNRPTPCIHPLSTASLLHATRTSFHRASLRCDWRRAIPLTLLRLSRIVAWSHALHHPTRARRGGPTARKSESVPCGGELHGGRRLHVVPLCTARSCRCIITSPKPSLPCFQTLHPPTSKMQECGCRPNLGTHGDNKRESDIELRSRRLGLLARARIWPERYRRTTLRQRHGLRGAHGAGSSVDDSRDFIDSMISGRLFASARGALYLSFPGAAQQVSRRCTK